ncbi:type VII secretion protein EccCb [Nocardia cyriacigeorgica]|uniref:type VII secretion protein EccCb n=1 Tax=Nocardia cyriacigeorgica TaxID=135487 RepID=UPI002455EC2F|nr:type VII secretion protein EccCb [Nocardia cyriacigeorgica]
MNSESGQRTALFIANDTYHFDGLSRLYAPVEDAEQLRELLRDPEIGGFRPADLLVNESKAEIERNIERLFRHAGPDDVVLLYFSGHGLRTRQNLYLATSNTDPQLVSSTGISAGFIREMIKESAAAAKIILLDCCYSGAFLGADVMKSTPTIDDVGEELAAGDGICILTAASAVETAEDGRATPDRSEPLSAFTAAMVKGISTGLADNSGGLISAYDLWNYVSAEVRGRTSRQTPNHYGVLRQEVYIAKVRRRHPSTVDTGERVQLGELLGRLERDPALGLRAESWWGTGRLQVPIGQERRPDGTPGETVWLDLAGTDGNLLVVGRAGAGKSTLLRTLAGSLALTHTPGEVQVYGLEAGNRLGSIAALPHITEVAGDDEPEQVQAILQRIVTAIGTRKKLYRANNIDSPASLRAARSLPAVGSVADIFLLLDRWGDFSDQIAKFADTLRYIAGAGPEYGVHVVATARDWSEIPNWLADLLPAHIELRLHRPEESRDHPDRAAQLPHSPGWALYRQRPFRIAMPDLRELAPETMGAADLTDGAAELVSRVVDARPEDSDTPVPARSLFDGEVDFATLFGLGPSGVVDVDTAWQSRWRGRLRIPIGVAPDGQPVELDLKEAAENGMGPHGLLVGAAGSGKSNLLTTIIAGLALTHSPEAVNFLLVDGVGEGVYDRLAGLPHVSSIVSALDSHPAQIRRLQLAIEGELERRQEHLHRTGRFASLRDYDLARERDAALPPLPTLFVAIDGFTNLLTAPRSDFLETLVAIGRLGRSLGVHLLLSTARLQEERMRELGTFLSYRIALRTYSAAESRTILGVPDAYELPGAPGHGYLRAEAGEPVRFKAAYASLPDPRSGRSGDAAAVQQTMVESVVAQLVSKGRPAYRIWLEFPERIPVADILARPEVIESIEPGGPSLRVPIGLLDLPQRHRQAGLIVDLSGKSGNIALAGGRSSGKSTALATIVLATAAIYPPEYAQFYLLDFDGALGALSALPHVGSVAGRSDPDRVRRTIAELESLLTDRKELFRVHGITSMIEFRARREELARRTTENTNGGARATRFGDVFLVVDDWRYARERDDKLDERLTGLAVEGLPYGIHLIVATTRWIDIRPSLIERFGTRLELRLDDPADSIFDRKAAALVPTVPGRGLTAITSVADTVLIAMPTMATPTADQPPSALLAAAARQLADAYPGRRAPEIRTLPDRIARAQVLELAAAAGIDQSRGRVVVGVRESDLRPLVLDFTEQPHLLVFGDVASGKTTLLGNIVTGMAQQFGAEEAVLVVADPMRGLLDLVGGISQVKYSPSVSGVAASVQQIASELARRMPSADISPQQLRDRSWWRGPQIFIVIDDYERLVTSANPLAPLVDYLAQGLDLGLHLIITRASTGASRALYDPVLSRMRELGADGLILSGSPDEGKLIGNVRATAQPPGRGTYISRTRPPEQVQISYLPQL